MADYEHIFRDAEESRGASLAVIEGAVPAALRGTFLRNGPGIQRAGADPLHFLDGHGLVAGVRFADGAAVYNARMVDTALLRRERAAGKMTARRPFTNLPGGRWANALRLQFRTGAAHDVYAWGGRVVACDVDGHYALDAATLETSGAAPISKARKGIDQLSPMPRRDPHTGRLVAYVMSPGVLGDDAVTFVEYDEAWVERARVTRRLGVKGALLHDLAVSKDHYVVAEFARLDVAAAAGGAATALAAASLPKKGPPRIVVVPRRGDGALREIPLPAGHQTFHLLNAFEDGSKLVVDATMYDGFVDFRDLYPSALRAAAGPAGPVRGPFVTRHTMDLATGATTTTVFDGARGESPSVRGDRLGGPYRYAYLSTPTSRGDEPSGEAYFWFHGVGKVDMETRALTSWDAGPRVFLSAPQFVARGEAEDDGWLLAWAYDAERDRGEVVVLDALELSKGPVARLALPSPLPAASHVAWSDP